MPYVVQPVPLPSRATLPNGSPSPQLQQFANQLAADLNNFEQRGFHLDHVVELGSAAVLVFRQ